MQRSAATAMCLCLLLLGVLTLGAPGTAQETAARPADGHDAAQQAFDTWYAGDYAKFHGMLSTETQGKVSLLNLDMRRRLERMNLSNAQAAASMLERLALLDPESKLELTSVGKLSSLGDAEFFALASGLLAVSYQLRKQANDRWAMVEYLQGVKEPDRKSAAPIIAVGALANFESVARLKFDFTLVREDSSFRVDDFELRGPRHTVGLARFLRDGASYDVRWPGVSPAEDRLDEGKALLVKFLSVGRDAYSKNRADSEAIEKMNEFGKSSESEGSSYELTKVRTGFGLNSTGVAIILAPKHEGDPWLLAVSTWETEYQQDSEHLSEEAALETLEKRIKYINEHAYDEPELPHPNRRR